MTLENDNVRPASPAYTTLGWNHVVLARSKYKGALIYRKRHPVANDNEFYFQVQGLAGEWYDDVFLTFKNAKVFIDRGYTNNV